MFLYIKRNKSGFPWDFMEQKIVTNSFLWSLGTEPNNCYPLGFEILGLGKSVILVCKKPQKG